MDFNRIKSGLQKTFKREKIMRFMDKHGFYIVLFICIALIAGTAFFTSGRGIEPNNGLQEETENPDDDPVENTDEWAWDEDVVDIDIEDVIMPDQHENPVESDDTAEPDETMEPDESSGSGEAAGNGNDEEASGNINDLPVQDTDLPVVNQEEPSKILMDMPVAGSILVDFCNDELVYSRTLREWRFHSGVDIGGILGDEVKAALAGTVEEIIEDPLMGITIILSHEEKLKTVYANLSTKDMVEVGQRVSKGQVISGIGTSAAAECLEAPHLHFEVLLDGQPVDPKEYLSDPEFVYEMNK